MFSTSVLECHKSLNQAMVKPSVLSENLPDVPGKRPSWPSRLGPGLFASDKENRPEIEAPEMKVTKSTWWQQQRDADALKQQQLQQRFRAGAEEQLQHVRSARRSEGGAVETSDSELRRRCQELELRARAALRLEAELEAEKAPAATKFPCRNPKPDPAAQNHRVLRQSLHDWHSCSGGPMLQLAGWVRASGALVSTKTWQSQPQ